MNDAYYNQDSATLTVINDLQVEQENDKFRRQMREAARLYAEGKMMPDWNRKDSISIAVFYNHYIDFLFNNYIK